jgi:hypothetical protein
MNFQQKLADFVLTNRTTSQHPDIALTGMHEQLESESLVILAGMNDRDNTFELDQYFRQMLSELQIELPSKIESVDILLNYYMNLIVAEPNRAFELMRKIHNQVHHAVEWPESHSSNKKKYVGEELGLEHLYTWYRELQDFEDGSALFYYNEFPRTKQKKKFEQHLVEEAQNWLKMNEKSHMINPLQP